MFNRKLLISLLILLMLLLVLAGTRIRASLELRSRTNAHVVPVVNVIVAGKGPLTEKIILPGSLAAWHEAPVYARTSGYIKQWYVDIGDKVKEGQLLALIEAPEVNAQLRQAKADLEVIVANNKLAQATATRWINLLKTDSVSKQETDEKVDAALALQASLLAAKANRDRLQDLVNFQRVIAPFAGTVSARATDIGALINAGSTPGQQPLFRIVQSDPLRMYVQIPENYVAHIKPGMQVDLTFAQHPGKIFPAKLFQTANAINPATRTLLAQFTVNNKEGILLPGSYTQVHFSMPAGVQSVRLPVNTLLFRAEGLQVATLDKNNRVVLKSVSIARDFGTEVEIAAGIKPGEPIIINPEDSIFNGQQVRLATTGKSAGKKK